MHFGEDDDDNNEAVQPLVERPRQKRQRRPSSPEQAPIIRSRYQEDSEAEDPNPQHYDRKAMEASNSSAEVFFDGNVGGPPKEKWIPYCPIEMDPEELDKYDGDEVKDANWCFLCYFSESTHRHEDYAVIHLFIRYIKENFDKVSPAVLTAQAQTYYKAKILPLWPHLPMFPRKQILYHFTIHQPDDFIMDLQELRTLNHASCLISLNELYEFEETSDNIRINPKAQAKYLGLRRRMDTIRERVSTKKSRVLH